MSYLEGQSRKVVPASDRVTTQKRKLIYRNLPSHPVTFPGGSLFRNSEREFVLSNSALNIWAGVREDAIAYFNRHEIPFWDSVKGGPTGHILSSQIACINHLYFVRQRKDIATAILQNVDNNVKSALLLEDGAADHGYVDFEVIGSGTRNFWLYFKKTINKHHIKHK